MTDSNQALSPPQHPSIMIPPTISRRSFLKTATALTGAAPMVASLLDARAQGAGAASGPLIAYVGTYSSPMHIFREGVDMAPGNGRGIHLFQVDRATGALTPHGLFEQTTSPNFLALNSSGTRLYSTNETENLQENGPGTVSAFAIDPKSGQLTLLNTVSSKGAGPSHLSVHHSGRFVLVANYFGGSVTVLPILADGRLGEATDFRQDAGTLGAKNPKSAPPGSFAISGHDAPHAHMIASDPSGRFVFSVEMGLDQILVWKFDDHAGTLSPNDPHVVTFPSGDGPRHFAFHPNKHWFYSLQEEGSTIALFDYDGTKGQLALRQTVPTLSPGVVGTNFTSEIVVSVDGRFVYAANRLRDTIACFSINAETGALTFVGEEWTRGDYPRNFNLDPSGEFLYIGNQRSDAIAIFRADRKTGALTFTGQMTPVGSPAVIVFVDFGKAG